MNVLLKVIAFLLAVFAVALLAVRVLTGEQIVLGIVALIITVNVIDMGRKQ